MIKGLKQSNCHFSEHFTMRNTFSSVSQLIAHNLSITCVPKVITNCAPFFSATDLYTSMSLISTTHQSQVTIGTQNCIRM